jgi:hypothetical protein
MRDRGHPDRMGKPDRKDTNRERSGDVPASPNERTMNDDTLPADGKATVDPGPDGHGGAPRIRPRSKNPHGHCGAKELMKPGEGLREVALTLADEPGMSSLVHLSLYDRP